MIVRNADLCHNSSFMNLSFIFASLLAVGALAQEDPLTNTSLYDVIQADTDLATFAAAVDLVPIWRSYSSSLDEPRSQVLDRELESALVLHPGLP